MHTQIVSDFIKIQPKGVMTIPKAVRERAGLNENELAKITADEKGRIIIEKVRTLPYPVRSYSDKEIKEFLALDSQESAKAA